MNGRALASFTVGFVAVLVTCTVLVTTKVYPQAAARVGCTIEQVAKIYNPDGSVRSLRETWYFHSGGSVRHDIVSDQFGPAIEYFDIPADRLTTTYRLNQTRTFREIGAKERERALRIPSSCQEALALPPNVAASCASANEAILGVGVQQLTVESPDVGRKRIVWVAPSLNYKPLRQLNYVNGVLTESAETISISLGDPDKALWAVPLQYTLVKDRLEFSKQVVEAQRQALGQIPPQ